MRNEVGNGWFGWRSIPRLAGGVVAAPVVVGFVALGAAVLMARSVRDVTREAWSWLPGRRAAPPPSSKSDSHAA